MRCCVAGPLVPKTQDGIIEATGYSLLRLDLHVAGVAILNRNLFWKKRVLVESQAANLLRTASVPTTDEAVVLCQVYGSSDTAFMLRLETGKKDHIKAEGTRGERRGVGVVRVVNKAWIDIDEHRGLELVVAGVVMTAYWTTE